MKIALVDKGKYASHNIRRDLKNLKFKIVNKNPDLVISHGGDGTFFISERNYPGVPKLLIRDSKICYFCVNENRDSIFSKLSNKNYRVEKQIKLKFRKLSGVNDIIIKSKKLTEALRFNLKVNGKDYGDFIGDGLVIATSYGSSGYFYSITRKKFSEGKIGIAFNNVRDLKKPLIVKDNAKIEVRVLRGIAEVGVDNNPKITKIKKKGVISITKSKEYVKIIKLK